MGMAHDVYRQSPFDPRHSDPRPRVQEHSSNHLTLQQVVDHETRHCPDLYSSTALCDLPFSQPGPALSSSPISSKTSPSFPASSEASLYSSPANDMKASIFSFDQPPSLYPSSSPVSSPLISSPASTFHYLSPKESKSASHLRDYAHYTDGQRLE